MIVCGLSRQEWWRAVGKIYLQTKESKVGQPLAYLQQRRWRPSDFSLRYYYRCFTEPQNPVIQPFKSMSQHTRTQTWYYRTEFFSFAPDQNASSVCSQPLTELRMCMHEKKNRKYWCLIHHQLVSCVVSPLLPSLSVKSMYTLITSLLFSMLVSKDLALKAPFHFHRWYLISVVHCTYLYIDCNYDRLLYCATCLVTITVMADLFVGLL